MATVTSLKFDITSGWTGDGVDDAQAQLQALKDQIDELNSKRLQITADATQVQAQIADVKQEMDTLSGDIKLGISDEGAEETLAALKAQLDSLTSQSLAIKVDKSQADAEMAALKVELDALTKDQKIKVEVDDDGLRDSLALATADVDKATADMSNDFDGVGKAGRAASLNLVSGLVMLAPALVPLSEAVLGFGGAAVAGFGSATLAGGAFGLSVGDTIKKSTGAVTALATLNDTLQSQQQALAGLTKGTAAYNSEASQIASTQSQINTVMSDLTPVQRQITLQLLSMESEWKNLQTVMEKATGPLIMEALQGISMAMQGLVPLVRATAAALKPFVDEWLQFTTSGSGGAYGTEFEIFIQYIIRNGIPNLVRLITFIQDIGKALIQIAQAFTTQGAGLTQWLDKIGASLDNWGSNGGFERFAVQVSAMMPDINKALGSLGEALAHAIEALHDFGGTALTELTIVSQLIAHLPIPVIEAFFIAFEAYKGIAAAVAVFKAFSLVIDAMKAAYALANVAQIAFRAGLEGTTAAEGSNALVTTAMTAGRVAMATATFIGTLATEGWAAAMLTADGAMAPVILTVGLIVLAIAGLAIGIYELVDHWHTVWTALKSAFDTAFAFVKEWSTEFALAFTVLLGPIGLFMAIGLEIITHWSDVKQWFDDFLNGLKSGWDVAWSAIKSAFDSAMNGIKAAWDTVSSALSSSWDATWNGIKTAGTAVWDAIKDAWSVVLNAFTAVWNTFAGIFGTLWHDFWEGDMEVGLRNFISAIIGDITVCYDALKAAWDTFASAMETAWDAVWDAMKAAGEAVWNAYVELWTVTIDTIMTVWDTVSSALSSAWDAVWDAMKTAGQAVWDAFVELWTVTMDAIMSVWDAVSAPLSAAWNTVWDAMKAAGEAVWSALDSAWTTFLDGIETAWNTVSSAISGVWDGFWNTIKSTATTVWGDITSGLGSFFSGIESGFTEVVSQVGSIWSGIESVFQTPVNFIIKVWNDVAGVIGLPTIGDSTPSTAVPFASPTTASASTSPAGTVSTGGAKGFAEGGWVSGPGTGTSDSIPAMVSHGEYIMPADKTKQHIGTLEAMRTGSVPHFSIGGIVGDVVGAVTGAAKDVGSAIDGVAGDAWSALSSVIGTAVYDTAKPVVDGIVSAVPNPVPGVSTPAGSVPHAGAQTLGDALLDKLKSSQATAQAAAASVGGTVPTGEHLTDITSALSKAGVPQSEWAQWEPGLNTIITSESGWNPTAINETDSNAAAGHPSQGLMQTIPSTFAAYSLGGSITDPVSNIVAGIRYIIATYGGIANVPGVKSVAAGGAYVGYDTGGALLPGLTLANNTTGTVEGVLNPTGLAAIGGLGALSSLNSSGSFRTAGGAGGGGTSVGGTTVYINAPITINAEGADAEQIAEMVEAEFDKLAVMLEAEVGAH